MVRLNPIQWWRDRRAARRTAQPTADNPAARSKLAAERAARRAAEAMMRDDDETARGFIRLGLHAAPHHLRLREMRARLALRDGDAHRAVRLLVGETQPNHRRRLLLNLARCQAAQRDAAELDLRQWTRDRQCPSEGRALLAWLLIEGERSDEARRVLAPNLTTQPDALTCQILLLLDLSEQLPRSTRQAAAHLAHGMGHDPHIAAWLDSFQLSGVIDQLDAPLPLIEQLAAQLQSRPHLIRSLTVAQHHHPSISRIALLRRALVRIVDQLDEPFDAIESLARLARLDGDVDDARRWARRGLKLRPYDAALALLLDQLADADEHEDRASPRPLQVLRRAVTAQPQFSDLRRALIHRYHKAGLKRQAVEQARRWAESQPDNHLAAETYRELAA